jgi:hypothetical protein
MPESKGAGGNWKPSAIWLAAGALGFVAVALAVIFAVRHTNGTSGPSDVVSGNAQPQSDVLIVDDCTDEGRFEPTTIQLTCGDGTAVAGNLTWSEWNSTIAVGQGTVNEVSCVPDCADGKDVVYSAKFTLSEPVRAESGKEYFTRVAISYIGKGPNGASTALYKDCFDTPPAPFIPACPADERGAN